MSIVIVGVGGADFSKMEFLDADDKALKASNGMKANPFPLFSLQNSRSEYYHIFITIRLPFS